MHKREKVTDTWHKCPCPGGHEGCTAQLKDQDPIGREGVYCEQMAEDFKKQGISLDTVGSDADSQIKSGIRKHFPDVEFQLDPRHFDQAITRKMKKELDPLSKMFDIVKTKQEKEKYVGFLAKDLVMRCAAEFKGVFNQANEKKLEKNEKKEFMNTKLANISETILDCYQGRHFKCQTDSFVCNPPKNIWSKPCLPNSLKNGIEMSPKDIEKIKTFINKRLGPTGIDQTYTNLNTQKVEAIHRLYQKTNPKNITSVQNFRPRILSAVVQTNLGLAAAIFKFQKKVSHVVSEEVQNKIISHYNKILLRKEYGKQKKAMTKRVQNKVDLIQLYEQRAGREGGAGKQNENNDIGYHKEIDMI